jgi:lysophospholipase L1-like esterase
VGFVLVLILLFAVTLEGGARLTFAFKDWFKTALASIDETVLNLNEYQMRDPRHSGNWILRPGFSETPQQVIEAKKKAGRILAEKSWKELVTRVDVRQDERGIRINRDGFRGPEIDKAHSHPRVLTLGDSCTFGSFLERYTYPRVLETEIRQRGSEVEVVNGGVEGYAPQNILSRIEDFKALRPEITTFYIGWNALYNENEFLDGIDRYLASVRLIKTASAVIHALAVTPQKAALESYNKPKHPRKDSPEVRRAENYSPSFIDDVDRIVREMGSVGSRVVIVTLPGLFTMDDAPSDLALKVGHLPPFTDNPYLLAKITERYNIALRELAKRRGLEVIDLEEWSRVALQPRDRYFFDSVHLYEEGQQRIGQYMAAQLLPILSNGESR